MMIVNKFGLGLLITAFLFQSLRCGAQEPAEPLKKVSKLKLDKRGARLFDFIEMFPDSSESAERVNQFEIEQNVTLSEIPPNAKHIKLWISLPGDERNQKLMNLDVNECPGKWNLVNDLDRRGNFLYVEIESPGSDSLVVKTSYQVRRSPEFTDIDFLKSGQLNEVTKQLLADHLVLDAPHMTVTPEFQAIADKVCGDESNIAKQARLILEHVASTVDHYSYTKDPSMPTCGIGDASVCKKQGGGCCTDLNSYFITLARARGIPARLNMGFRLPEKNRDKLLDAGYRCWVEYFVPNYGWISADVVEADTPGGLGHERWLSGLTSRRIWLNQGREFAFADKVTPGRINNMTIGYAEIDGQPVRLLPEGELKPQLTRTIRYSEESDSGR